MKTPYINKQTKQQLLQKIEELGKNFLPQWKPSEDDPGWAIAQTFTDMHTAIDTELNRVPEKLFLSYLNQLGFRQTHPLSAKAPVTFFLNKKFKGNVLIEQKTEVQTEDKVSFEVDNNFTAQSSKLTALIYTDSINDNIVDISEQMLQQETITLFEKKETFQYLYFGDDNLFNFHSENGDDNAYVNLVVSNIETVKWQYWGKSKTSKEGGWIDFEETNKKHLIKQEIKPTLQGGKSNISIGTQLVGYEETNEKYLNKHKMNPTQLKEINGITSYWIRAVLSPPKKEQVSDYKIGCKIRSGIDALYYNTQPICPEKTIHPFGLKPQEQDIFYIASNEAFSKKGALCGIYMSQISCTPQEDGNVGLQFYDSEKESYYSGLVSFQYFNGKAWKNLIIKPEIKNAEWVNNGVNVSFKIPQDLQKATVNGDNNFWIRLQLISSKFGHYYYDDDQIKEDFHAPSFKNLDIYIDSPARETQYILHEAHNTFTNMIENTYEKPYSWLEESHNNTLYLGFDKSFSDGLISMLMSLESNPNVNYLSNYSVYTDDGWQNLVVKDDSYGLMKSGICSFTLKNKQQVLEKFSYERYWLKVEFVTADDSGLQPIRLNGIYLNSVMATQTKSIEKKHLGISNGSVFQSFKLEHSPVINVKIWIKEAYIPNDAPYYIDEFNEGYWVEWKEVKNFSAQTYDKRVYCVDSHSGIIKFADIKTGRIPPISKDSILVSYQLSEGVKGNVAKNSITKLNSSIAYVDKINNFESASGGANEQSIESLINAAPKQIRHHYQAVTKDDFEALVYEASSNIAKSHVYTSAGIVNISIIPFDKAKRPLGSQGLKELIYHYIKKRTAATIKIFVEEPEYVPISLELHIIVDDWNLISTLKNSLQLKIDTFLHPLNGGLSNQGWSFGEVPTLAHIFKLLHNTEGITYIKSAEVRMNNKILYDINGQKQLEINKEIMIFSGQHSINIETRSE